MAALDTVTTNYAKFDGRASKHEYASFVLIAILVNIFTFLVGVVTGMPYLQLAGAALLLIPSWAVTIRRLQDSGLRWGWALMIKVPKYLMVASIFVATVSATDAVDPATGTSTQASSPFNAFAFVFGLTSFIAWVYLMSRHSEAGDNQHGPNPEAATAYAAYAKAAGLPTPPPGFVAAPVHLGYAAPAVQIGQPIGLTGPVLPPGHTPPTYAAPIAPQGHYPPPPPAPHVPPTQAQQTPPPPAPPAPPS